MSPKATPAKKATTATTTKKAAAAKTAPAKAPAKSRGASSDLADRMAGLTAQRVAGKKSAGGRSAPAPMPATVAASGPAYPKRMTLPLTVEDHRALRVAHLDDGVEATARLRAMLALWQQDERLRARIDKLARQMSR